MPEGCDAVFLRYPLQVNNKDELLEAARRALRGSLNDPTDGATAFHRVDDNPDWTRAHLPVAIAGPFLFYRV